MILNTIKDSFYVLMDYLVSRKWRKSVNCSHLNGIVLMFHHITDDFVDINNSCRCPVKVFTHYLDYYLEKGYRFVSIDEAYNLMTGAKDKSRQEPPFCVITFDDVPDDVYVNAYPILKSKRIPFTLFVTSKYIDYIDPVSKRKFITKS